MDRNEILECLAEHRQREEEREGGIIIPDNMPISEAGTHTGAGIYPIFKKRKSKYEEGVIHNRGCKNEYHIDRIHELNPYPRGSLSPRYIETNFEFNTITEKMRMEIEKSFSLPSSVIEIPTGELLLGAPSVNMQNTEFELEFKFHYDNSPEKPITKKETVFAGSLQEACGKIEKKYPNVTNMLPLRYGKPFEKDESSEVNLQNKVRMDMDYSNETLELSLRTTTIGNDIDIMITDCYGNQNVLMSINPDGTFTKCRLGNKFLKHFKTINEKIKEEEE